MAQTIDQIMASRASLFDPEKALVNSQIAALPGQQAAEQAGLDQAKTNSFRDITNSANARGVLYGGAPIDEQQTYVGTKFLPAVADLKNNYLNKSSALQSTLIGINQKQNQDATGIQSAQTSAEIAAQKAADDRAYNDRKLQEDRAYNQSRLQAAATKASQKAPADAAKGFVRNLTPTGLAYRDSKGNPITSAQYYDAKGASGINAILSDLQASSNPGDAKIAQKVATDARYRGSSGYDNLAKDYPYIFGGV